MERAVVLSGDLGWLVPPSSQRGTNAAVTT
jgi:hypothetical protein